MTCPEFEVARSVPVRCTNCNQSDTLHLDIACSEILERTGKIHAYCSYCKSLADLIRIDSEPSTPMVEPDLLVTAQEIFTTLPAPTQKKRELRICPKNMDACIRRGHSEDIARVIDYCRTGARLSSSASYKVGEFFEVAVDYAKGGMNIFQPAHVSKVYCSPQPDSPGEFEISYKYE